MCVYIYIYIYISVFIRIYTHSHTHWKNLHRHPECTFSLGLGQLCRAGSMRIWPCTSYVERCRLICGLLHTHTHTHTHTQFISHNRIITYTSWLRKGVGGSWAFSVGAKLLIVGNCLFGKLLQFHLIPPWLQPNSMEPCRSSRDTEV